MEREMLKKVQSVMLEILKEVRRVCDENDIPYVLHAGTFLGAVRHQGFIPWDDDLDIAMLRPDYERFRQIAPEKLGENYCFQDWHTDEAYAHPFGKVRKRNTVYVEAKCARLPENGVYIDVFPLDTAPDTREGSVQLQKKLIQLYRLKLMKCRYTPWKEEDRIIWKKRIGYLPYQLAAAFLSQKQLVNAYESLVRAVPEGEHCYEQCAAPRCYFFEKKWFRDRADYPFVDGRFAGPRDFDTVLTEYYGDYMTLPPVEERENRHQIMEIQL